MSHQARPDERTEKGRPGFPVELKLLLVVIMLGVLTMLLKATGII